MRRYSIEPSLYVKGYEFLLFARKYKKQSLDAGLNAVKTASKNVVHKPGESLGNKIADTATKSNDNKIQKSDENPRNVEEIIIPPEERHEILNKLRQVLL